MLSRKTVDLEGRPGGRYGRGRDDTWGRWRESLSCHLSSGICSHLFFHCYLFCVHYPNWIPLELRISFDDFHKIEPLALYFFFSFIIFILHSTVSKLSTNHFSTSEASNISRKEHFENWGIFTFSFIGPLSSRRLLTSVFSKSDGFPTAAQWTQKWDNANCLFHYEIHCDGYPSSISMDIRDHHQTVFMHINPFYYPIILIMLF